jgi:hypothetical protein
MFTVNKPAGSTALLPHLLTLTWINSGEKGTAYTDPVPGCMQSSAV